MTERPPINWKYYAAAFVAACCIFAAISVYGTHEAGPLAKFNTRVQAAYGDTYDRLEFPRSADEKYKGQAGGFVAGCLDSCLGRKTDFFGQRIKLKNCRTGCACIANARITASPSDFVYNIKKPSKEEITAIQECVAK